MPLVSLYNISGGHLSVLSMRLYQGQSQLPPQHDLKFNELMTVSFWDPSVSAIMLHGISKIDASCIVFAVTIKKEDLIVVEVTSLAAYHC